MDEAVRRAIGKWPNVPAVHGWLALDRRGRWLLRGEPIDNPIITAFIARNYERDASGRWFFQNGPQRVYVDLDYAPLVATVAADGSLITHIGQRVSSIEGAWMDEQGRLLVATEHGPALVDDRDIESLSPSIRSGDAGRDLDEDALIAAIETLQGGSDAGLRLHYAGRSVPLQPILTAEVPARLGFDPHPHADAAEPRCD